MIINSNKQAMVLVAESEFARLREIDKAADEMNQAVKNRDWLAVGAASHRIDAAKEAKP